MSPFWSLFSLNNGTLRTSYENTMTNELNGGTVVRRNKEKLDVKQNREVRETTKHEANE